MANKKFSDPIGRQRRKPVLQLFIFSGMYFACALAGFAAEMAKDFVESNRLQSIEVNGHYDPVRNYLAATARLQFAEPADERFLWLASGLQLSSVSSGSLAMLDFKRDSRSLIVQNSSERELEFRYSGWLDGGKNSGETNGEQAIGESRNQLDDYHILSYVKDFYPHPLLDFTPMKMNISIPGGWSCLGSGSLLDVQADADGSKYMFDSVEAKGMVLICGRFRQIGLIESEIPIRLHGVPGFRYKNYFSETEMKRILSFYCKHFGPLSVPELNVLFRRAGNFCGISYKGLIVLDVDTSWPRVSALAKKQIEWGSMLSMAGAQGDLLAHEMAHQWWGGQISWKTAADNWITEGLATYSTLAYLRDRHGEKAYRKILRRLRQKVKIYARQGFPAAGYKLKAMQNDFKVYQALVYIKPALMLAALADRIGQGELLLRLRSILTDCHCRNVGSAEFLSMLSKGDKNMMVRLDEWIHAKGLPAGL
jgi:hypothetical protein